MRFSVHYREDAPVHVALAAIGLLIWDVNFSVLMRPASVSSASALVWLMAILALAGLAKAVLLVRDNTPTLRLGPDGIADRRWSQKPISWFNIVQFDPLRRFGVWVVELRLQDRHANPPTTLFGKLARSFGLVPHDAVLLLVPGLDTSAEDLSARILEIGSAAIEAAEEAEEWAAAGAYAAPPNG